MGKSHNCERCLKRLFSRNKYCNNCWNLVGRDEWINKYINPNKKMIKKIKKENKRNGLNNLQG